MNDVIFDPPSPAPQPKKGVTINPKFAIAFAIAALVLLIVVIAAPASTPPTTTTTQAPETTLAPVVNKYDTYLEHLYNNSGQANTWSKAQLIEFGDTVCQALDQGSTVRQVVNLLSSYAKTPSDIELFAAVAWASITYICPEYKTQMDNYLNS